MKGKYPLNRPKLHKALLELLQHPEVVVRFKHMTAQSGLSDWDDVVPPTNIIISVNANDQTAMADHVAIVIHELLHVMFMPMCLGWLTEEVEEVVILALDAHMSKYVMESPARLHRWEKEIAKKIALSDKMEFTAKGRPCATKPVTKPTSASTTADTRTP